MSAILTVWAEMEWRLRTGLLVLVTACLPFLVGRLAAATDLDTGSPALCPFRAVVGLPCPFCGATRAFALAAEGDPGFLEYNGAWVIAAALAAGFGVVLLAVRVPSDRLRRRAGGWMVWALALLMVIAWAWALLNRDAILAG